MSTLQLPHRRTKPLPRPGSPAPTLNDRGAMSAIPESTVRASLRYLTHDSLQREDDYWSRRERTSGNAVVTSSAVDEVTSVFRSLINLAFYVSTLGVFSASVASEERTAFSTLSIEGVSLGASFGEVALKLGPPESLYFSPKNSQCPACWVANWPSTQPRLELRFEGDYDGLRVVAIRGSSATDGSTDYSLGLTRRSLTRMLKSFGYPVDQESEVFVRQLYRNHDHETKYWAVLGFSIRNNVTAGVELYVTRIPEGGDPLFDEPFELGEGGPSVKFWPPASYEFEH